MPPIERRRLPGEVVGSERSLEVHLGALGGFELRPTRLFLWRGRRQPGAERLLPLADRPVGLEYERRETETRAGAVAMRTRGNPLMTVALAGAIAVKRWLDAPEDER